MFILRYSDFLFFPSTRMRSIVLVGIDLVARVAVGVGADGVVAGPEGVGVNPMVSGLTIPGWAIVSSPQAEMIH